MMLPPKDAALVETFAKECEQRAQQIVIDGARSETRRSIGPPRPRDRVFQSASGGIPPNRAALEAHVRWRLNKRDVSMILFDRVIF